MPARQALVKRLLAHGWWNAAIQALNICTGLLAVLLLPVEELGYYAIAMVVAGTYGLLGTLRCEWIIFNTRTKRGARWAAEAGMAVAVLCAPFATSTMFLFHVLEFLNFEKISALLMLQAGLYASTFAAQRMVVAHHLTSHSLRANVQLRWRHAIARLSATALLCVLFGTAQALFLAETVATFLLIFFAREWSLLLGMFRGVRVKFAWLLKRHGRMLLSATPSAIVTSLGNSLGPTVLISVFNAEAGGLFYIVRRIVGTVVRFLLVTVGEVWHKFLRQQNYIALWIGTHPVAIVATMVTIILGLLAVINGATYIAFSLFEVERESKLGQSILAMQYYQLGIAMVIGVNLFNRILVARDIVYKKLIPDGLLLLAPLPLYFLVPWIQLDIFEAIALLSILQAISYLVLAIQIVRESAKWRHECKVQQ